MTCVKRDEAPIAEGGRASITPCFFAVSSLPPFSHQIQEQTESAEGQLAEAMERVGHLDRQVDALKMKWANNSLAATRAEETANAARDRAGEAKQVCGDGLQLWELGSEAAPWVEHGHIALPVYNPHV